MKDHDATELAYKNGYKKAVEDIFYDIEDALECAYDLDQQSDYPMPHYHDYLKDDIAELKKKYTEDL